MHRSALRVFNGYKARPSFPNYNLVLHGFPVLMSAPFPAEMVDAFDVLRVTFFVESAAMAITLYDPVITLCDEIDMLWMRPWTWANIVYLINRYFVPIQAVLAIVMDLDANVSSSNCLRLYLFAELWSFPIITATTESLLVMRVCALYGNETRVRIGLWVLLAFSFASTAAMIGITASSVTVVPSMAPAVMGCFPQTAVTPLGWGIWIPPLCVETVLVILTVAKTIEHVQVAVNTPVLTVILRDGCVYFTVIFVLMLSNMIIYAMPSQTEGYISVLTELQLSLASVLTSRMFLNLRSALYQHKPLAGNRTAEDEESVNTYELEARRSSNSRARNRMEEFAGETDTTNSESAET